MTPASLGSPHLCQFSSAGQNLCPSGTGYNQFIIDDLEVDSDTGAMEFLLVNQCGPDFPDDIGGARYVTGNPNAARRITLVHSQCFPFLAIWEFVLDPNNDTPSPCPDLVPASCRGQLVRIIATPL
jgi:hypothetical protein